MSLDIPDRKDASEAKDGDIPSNAHEPLSARGRRAMQGRREVNSAEKGSKFEDWAQENIFQGEARRLTVYPEDNPHLDSLGDGVGISKERRQSDAFIDEHGELYELKAGYEHGGIDKEQAYEYSLMQEAGKVNERDERGIKRKDPTEITGVSYIFDSQAGARANQLELEQYSFGIFYRDEQGQLQQLKEQ